MEKFKSIFNRDYVYFVGSGSSAVYIYLKHSKIFNKHILCPSNICYSIPYTIKFSKNTPLFYDVLEDNGNPDINSIRQLLLDNQNIMGIILPHMYGNYLINREKIIELCLNHNLIVLEDFASGIGCNLNFSKTHSHAEFFSFGKNKQIELGFGGILVTDEEIDIEAHEKEIKNDFKSHLFKVEFFERIYKKILYSDYFIKLMPFMRLFTGYIKGAFVYKHLWTDSEKDQLYKELVTLNEFKEKSYNKVLKIEETIDFNNSYLQRYNFNKGSSPWRFNVIITDKTVKKAIIKAMLLHELPISTWYPPIDLMFNQPVSQNSKLFFEQIINLNFSNLKDDDLVNFAKILNTKFYINE